jgi:hypothetical protein
MTVRRRPGWPPIPGLILGVLLAACGPTVSATARPAPAASSISDMSPSAIAASPTGQPLAVGSAAGLAVGSAAGLAVGSAGSARPSPAVPIDPTLLSILPATVDGQTISEVPEVEAGIVTDPSLVANATGLAVALGVDLSSGEFAYIAVIRLKPLVFSNAFYLSWRQSYDQGACSQSNGVESTSTTTIAGRQVFVGTCAGGASTYHIHLTAPDRLVSITSSGTSHYGALVLAGLIP